MALSQDFLQELKYNNEIVSLVSSYVNLRRSARNYVGLCPFHSEKSPSFTVFPDSQSYYCFGCGAGGDAITFIRQIENLDYIEAVRFLAQRAGMAMPEETVDDRAARLKNRIYELNRAAGKFYHESLLSPAGREALQYLADRGVSPAVVRRFGMGFAPNSWNETTRHLRSLGFRDEEMVAAGIAGNKNGRIYDQFRNRVMFPIIDLRGNVIAFGGRILGDGKPKYLNSPDTPVFKKTRNLFAMNFAKNTKERRLILAEGYMDVVAIHQAGFTNTVASLGTALTAEQARLISGYADEIIIAYDSDNAGQAATRRAFKLFDELGMKVRVLSIPDAKDPDEYIKKFGAQRFKLLLDGSASVTDFQLAAIAAKYDINQPADKVSYLRECAQVLAGIGNPIERDVYLRKLSNDLNVSYDAILAQVKGIMQQRRRTQQKKEARDLRVGVDPGNPGQADPQRRKHLREAAAEDILLGVLLKNPDALEHITATLQPEDFATDFNRRVFMAICQSITDHSSCDLTTLSQQFSPEEMARISGILARRTEPGFDRTLVDDCISVLKQGKDTPTKEQVLEMNDDDLRQMAQRLAQKKK